MPSFSPPVTDHLFCLYELLGFESHTRLPGFEGFSRDVIEAVLGEAARFTSDVVAPLNRSADEEGVHFDSGTVTTPRASGTPMPHSWPAAGRR